MERAFEKGEWRRVEYKKRRTKTQVTNHTNRQEVTTFFVSNIPEGITSKMLWMECRNLGILTDVFIPNKKDKFGGRFAFVRFKNVKNIELMEKTLGNIKIEGAKLTANLAKFDTNGNKQEDKMRNQGSSSNSRQNLYLNKHATGNVSYKEALAAVKNNGSKLIEVKAAGDSTLMVKCKGRSLIGETKTIDILQELDKYIKMFDENNVDIRYLGGFKVMLTFESENRAVEILDSKAVWSKFFASLYLWKGQKIDMERIAWFNIHGVPPQAWDTDVFFQIGSSLGRVTFLGNADMLDADLSKKLIGITMKVGSSFNPICEVNWKDITFKALISETGEDWIPEFMKSKAKELKTTNCSSENPRSIGDDVPSKINKETKEALMGDEGLLYNSTNIGSANSPNASSFGRNENVGCSSLMSSNRAEDRDSEDPFGLNDLIFNFEKGNNKKRKRRPKSPTNKKMRKKIFGVKVIDGVKHVNRNCSPLRTHEDYSNIGQSTSTGLNDVSSPNPETMQKVRDSVDLNRSPVISVNLAGTSDEGTNDNDNGQKKNDDLENEVQDTIEIGRCIGVDIDDFANQIRMDIVGEGVAKKTSEEGMNESENSLGKNNDLDIEVQDTIEIGRCNGVDIDDFTNQIGMDIVGAGVAKGN